MAKLIIPGPREEPPELLSSVDWGVMVSLVVALLLVVGLGRSGADGVDAPGVGTEPAAHVEQRRRQETVARLASLKREEREGRQWTTDERVSVFRYGAVELKEELCDVVSGALREGTLEAEVSMELLRQLDRRSESAPRACLVRLHESGGLKAGPLREEVAQYREELWRFEAAPGPVARMVDRYRETRQRPESAEFERWLRRCGLHPEYPAAGACQRLLRQLSPRWGGDMLEVLESELGEEGLEPEWVTRLIRAVGRWVRQGQPEPWKVVSTKELPGYDVDFRQGALLYLCRFMNDPDPELAKVAAQELASTAGYAARAYDAHLRDRWREACRLGFSRTGETDDEAVQLLAVWDGEAGHAPDYRLSQDVGRGVCEVREGYPIWYCGSRRWRGEGRELSAALQRFMVETRAIETQDWE